MGWLINHRFSNKKYKELIDAWNPYEVIYIHYRTPYSTGTMRVSVKFFLEFNNRINKLFKGCEIIYIVIKDDVNCKTIRELSGLYETWLYCLGRLYDK